METGNPMSSTTGIFLVVLLTILLVFGVFIYHFFRDRKLLKSVTSLKRGTASERDLVLRLLKKGMPAIIFMTGLTAFVEIRYIYKNNHHERNLRNHAIGN